ncbi:MAG: ribosome-associated translation inhibitor RaiA [Propionibacteriaceae bacterium]|jgi:ribosomal subunit interface protein|nr:ribosome-associated translation inhibitor RaiA [Propionibacteriaceae bacterium]
MDVNVSGRHCSINEELKDRVIKQIDETATKLGGHIIRADVEFTAIETGSDKGVKVEITLRSKGPVVLASGTAAEKQAAFDVAFEKLKAQLRKAADRRKSRRGQLRIQEFADVALTEASFAPAAPPASGASEPEEPKLRNIAGIEVEGDGPLVVREKEFTSPPLTLAQALDEMELVGHDFFLYVDAATSAPSVVYRRHAYNYGVIHLQVS